MENLQDSNIVSLWDTVNHIFEGDYNNDGENELYGVLESTLEIFESVSPISGKRKHGATNPGPSWMQNVVFMKLITKHTLSIVENTKISNLKWLACKFYVRVSLIEAAAVIGLLDFNSLAQVSRALKDLILSDDNSCDDGLQVVSDIVRVCLQNQADPSSYCFSSVCELIGAYLSFTMSCNNAKEYQILHDLIISVIASPEACRTFLRSIVPLYSLNQVDVRVPKDNKSKNTLVSLISTIISDFLTISASDKTADDQQSLIQQSILSFLHRCIISAAELPMPLRSLLTRNIILLTTNCSSDTRNKLIMFVIKLSHHAKLKLRSIAIDIIGLSVVNSPDNALMIHLMDRLLDKSSSVRLRAINNLLTIQEGRSYCCIDLNILIDISKKDDFATVRKTSLSCLYYHYHDAPLAVIAAIQERLEDKSLSVRSLAVKLISKLITEGHEDDALLDLWVCKVIPIVHDIETSVSNQVASEVYTVLLSPLLTASSSSSVPALLNLIETKGKMKDIVHILTCNHLALDKHVLNKLFSTGRRLTNSDNENENAGWILLDIVTCCYQPSSPDEFILTLINFFHSNRSAHDMTYKEQKCLSILSHFSFIPSAECKNMVSVLISMLSAGNLRPSSTSAITAFLTIHSTSRSWIDGILNCTCLDILSSSSSSQIEPCLFLCGELCLIDFQMNDDSNQQQPCVELISIVQSYLTSPVESIQAHAVICIGKFCLISKRLSRQIIPDIIRTLTTSPHPSVRNNILLVLSDLCMKHTSLVDVYCCHMAECLVDPSNLVKQHALLLLSELLLHDYLKNKGLLFHKLISCMVDEDESVSLSICQLIFGPLLAKNPNLLLNHFIELVVVMNGFTTHPSFALLESACQLSSDCDASSSLLTSSIQPNTSKRREIYHLMIKNMISEHKLQLSSKLVSDIIGFAIDSVKDNDEDDEDENEHHKNSMSLPIELCLMDALWILRLDDLKPDDKHKNDDEEEEDEEAKAILATKSAVMLKMSRTHLLESILPSILSLKVVLERCASAAQKDVLLYLVYLWKTSEKEVREVLSSDPFTLQELEYDVKMFERRSSQQVVQVAAIVASSSVTPNKLKKSASTPTSARLRPVLTNSSRKESLTRTPNESVLSALQIQSPIIKNNNFKQIDSLQDFSSIQNVSNVDLAKIDQEEAPKTRKLRFRRQK